MGRSDNTSSGSRRPSAGLLSGSGARLRLTPKHKAYLADVGVALMLAALLWGFAVAAGVLQP